MDIASLSEQNRSAFTSKKKTLIGDAKQIAEVQNIDKQRGYFANLSLNMFDLAKSAGPSKQPIYEDYCPMKKAYWLSSEKEIKNPYFGEQMPTSGHIKQQLP